MTQRLLPIATLTLLFFIAPSARAAHYPTPREGNATFKDFHFASGETLPELRIHYRTLGAPVRDSKGLVRNAVLIGHGTGGTGAQFIRPEFAGELFVASRSWPAAKSSPANSGRMNCAPVPPVP